MRRRGGSRLSPSSVGRRRLSGELEKGGHEVDVRDRGRDHAAGELAAGEAQQERHADGGVVDEVAVVLLAVLAEPFAVVGGHRERGAAEQPAPLELAAEAADELVDVGDLGLVRAARGSARRTARGGV